MSSRPTLYYFNGRGRGESIRWMLAAGGVEFDEVFLTTREQYLELLSKDMLLYEQVPMLEIDGLKLVQSAAILHYLARKFDMHGKNLKEQAFIDMYLGGIADAFSPMLGLQFAPEERREKMKLDIIKKLHSRYLPVFEKALGCSPNGHIAGTDNISIADVQLIDGLLSSCEIDSDVLSQYEQLKKFLERSKTLPWVIKFLSSEGKRKPIADQHYVETVQKVLAR